MTEGWHDNDYVILFSQEESRIASEAYDVDAWLSCIRVVGLRSWHDLIVADESGKTFTVPSVPLLAAYLTEYSVPAPGSLVPDVQYVGKVKWLIKPLVFGGDPQEANNVTWVTHQQHAELVRWWNGQYRALKTAQS